MSAAAERPSGEPGPLGKVAAFLIVCALVCPLVLALGMTKGLSHDEHQHIAAGALVGREGLLPYRDFPHFHTPYLAFVYALLFRASDHLLLAARLFSVACATAIVGVVGSIGWSLFRDRGKWIAAAVSAGAALLCVSAGIFGQATGRAWNHEPALLFTVLAFGAHVAGLRREKRSWLIASGALLGVAIGLRITVAPLVAPFGLALILFSPPPRWKPGLLVSFAAGLLVGTLGIFALAVIAPEQTFFGNFGFAKVNVAYRIGSGEPRTMTLLKKFRFVWKEIARHDLPLLAIGLLPLVALRLGRRGSASSTLRFEFWFILLLVPFLLIGSLAPSPLFAQYFYPFFPFLVLAGLYGLTSVAQDTPLFRRTLWAGLAIVVTSIVLGLPGYVHIRNLFSPSEWTGIEIHTRALDAFAQVPAGRVLTLAPIHPLEASRSIYPALATGPFAWRVAEFVEPARAARLGMISPRTLDVFLQENMPAAILFRSDPAAQTDFFEYATKHGYHAGSSSAGDNLWIRQ